MEFDLEGLDALEHMLAPPPAWSAWIRGDEPVALAVVQELEQLGLVERCDHCERFAFAAFHAAAGVDLDDIRRALLEEDTR